MTTEEHDEIQEEQTPTTKKSGQSGPFVPLIERATNPFMRLVLAYMREHGIRAKEFQRWTGIHSQRWSTMAKSSMTELSLTIEEIAVFAGGLHVTIEVVMEMYAQALAAEDMTHEVAVEDLARAGTELWLVRTYRFFSKRDRADIQLFVQALAERGGKALMPKRRIVKKKEKAGQKEPTLAG